MNSYEDKRLYNYERFFIRELKVYNLTLNKLIYLTQCVSYIDELDFKDCSPNLLIFQARRIGIISPRVYVKYKIYGPSQLIDYDDSVLELSIKERSLLELVVEKYKKIGPWGLVKFIHRKNGPWYEACKDFINEEGNWDERKENVYRTKYGYKHILYRDMQLDGIEFVNL